MKKINKYILITLSGLLLSACLQIEEKFPEELVNLQFTASTEGSYSTKTTMTGALGEETHSVLWCPWDFISIVPVVKLNGCYNAYIFNNTFSEQSQVAVFDGLALTADSYFAYYPVDGLDVTTFSSDIVEINLPDRLTYQEGTFSTNSFPMAAFAASGEDLSFNNLCGILAIRLTGTETIKSLTFVSTNNQKVSGTFSLDLSDGNFEISRTDKSLNSITMDCGDEGVTLNEQEPTVFYFVLPPQVYETFSLQIVTTDGNMMFKTATKPLEIKRSVLTPAGALTYVESLTIDLSERGTSNCYVVPSLGKYKFNATIIGNGVDGIIPDADFHTTNPTISPSSVEVLWEAKGANVYASKGEVLTNVTLTDDGYVEFLSTGLEGNAVVAVKDADSTIIWSWHLWFTDQPKDQLYINDSGDFHVMDRSLGAIRADRGEGDEWKESKGVLYQWGRKDPIVNGLYSLNSSADELFSIISSIQNPTVLPYSYSTGVSWVSPNNKILWSTSQKTIYDPCPVGYRVPDVNVWSGFKKSDGTLNTSGEYNCGWYFNVNDNEVAWYPANDKKIYSGAYKQRTDETDFWYTSSLGSFYISRNQIEFSYWSSSCYSTMSALSVRCMRDEVYVDPSIPSITMSGVKDRTTESAVVEFKVLGNGSSEITELGVVYGTTPGVTLENGSKVVAAAGESQIQITGLSEGTKYYVAAYATNSFGTGYSKQEYFYTHYSGYENFVNLSEAGTANCYIISESVRYMFDASVKGNSNELVGEIADVEVLWETKGLTPAEKGEIVCNVQLSGDYVLFESTGVEGNALIAVKDASGNILWSWHIWATDEPVEHHYVGSTEDFYVLDRNIGAVRADRGDGEEWKESVGTQYQRGRKDPFVKGLYTVASSPYSTVEQSVANPTEFSSKSSNSWLEPKDYTLWSATEKTIYDPCPLGYRVATRSVFSCLTSNEAPGNGVYYYYDGENTAWYPGTPHNDCYGSYRNETGLYAYMWVSNATSTSSYEVDAIYFSTNSSGYVSSSSRSNGDSYPVRCMKE